MDKRPASSTDTEIPPRPLWAYRHQHIKSSQKYNVYIHHCIYSKKGTAMSQEELFLLILSVSSVIEKTILNINTKSEKPNQWEDGGDWRHVFPWRHGVNETNHRGACSAKWLTRIFQLQRNGYNFCIFHSRQISFLHSAWGIVTNYVSRIYDVRRNRATQLVE